MLTQHAKFWIVESCFTEQSNWCSSCNTLNHKLLVYNNSNENDKTSCLEKGLMLGKVQGKRRRERPPARWMDSMTVAMDAPWEEWEGPG